MKLTAYVPNGPYTCRRIAEGKDELANWLRVNCPNNGGVTVIMDSGQSKTELIEVCRASYCASMDAYEFSCRMFSFNN